MFWLFFRNNLFIVVPNILPKYILSRFVECFSVLTRSFPIANLNIVSFISQAKRQLADKTVAVNMPSSCLEIEITRIILVPKILKAEGI